MSTHRQSRLRAYHECPRRCLLEVDWTSGLVGAAADLGSAVHATVAEIERTMWRTGETQVPTQEAVEVLYEQLNAGPWVLGTEDLDVAVQCVLKFCEERLDPGKFLGIEDKLTADVVCPDGATRTLTGTPDLLIADPDSHSPGVVIVDYKTGKGKPREPRTPPPEGQPIVGEDYLHAGGHFQLRTYGYLAMRRYPRVQRATLKQVNLRWGGPPRVATIERPALEHVERQLGLLLMQLDEASANSMRAFADDPTPLVIERDAILAELECDIHSRAQLDEALANVERTLGLVGPRPGAHCNTRCAVARSCPVPQEQRGVGAIGDAEQATREAERLAMVSGLRKQITDALKAYVESTGEPIRTTDGILDWHEQPSGGRRFIVK